MGKYKNSKLTSKKKVQETYMQKFKKIRNNCLGGLIAGLVIFAITLIGTITSTPVSRNELTPISGEFEYYRHQSSGGLYTHKSYIAIGIKGHKTEYHLSSIEKDEFDYSFLEEVNVGDIITLYIDKSDDRELSVKGVDKEKWNYFYTLKAGNKEYFSYDDYLKGYNDNKNLGIGVMYFGLTIMVSAPIVILISYFVCKKKDGAT